MAAIMVTLSACGTPDASPLSITARTPAPLTTDAWVGTPISVTFSKPVAADSVSEFSAVLLADGVAVPAERVLVDGGTRLVVTPNRALSVPAEVALELTTDITDHAGRPLVLPDVPHRWSLAAWQGAADVVTTTAVPSSLRSVAVLDDGGVLVALEEYVGMYETTTTLWRITSGRGPAAASEAFDVAGEVSTSGASVGQDAHGQPIAAWMRGAPSPLRLRAARLEAGAWETTLDTEATMTGYVLAPTAGEAPTVLRSPSGTPLLLYRARHQASPTADREYRTHLLHWDDGSGSWLPLTDPWTQIEAHAQSNLVGRVAADGSVLTAWTQTTSEAQDVRFAAFDGLAWTVPYPPLPSAGPVYRRLVDLAVDATGHPTVLVETRAVTVPFDGRTLEVYAWDGATWRRIASALVEEGAGRDPIGGSLVALGDGDVVVTFTARPEPDQDHALHVVRAAPGSDAWTTLPAPVGPAGDAQRRGRVIARLGTDGRPWLTWREVHDDGSTSLHVRRWNGP